MSLFNKNIFEKKLTNQENYNLILILIMAEPYHIHLTPLNWIFLRLGGASAHIGNMIEQFNIPNTVYSRGFFSLRGVFTAKPCVQSETLRHI